METACTLGEKILEALICIHDARVN
jgi:hypothetical protein